MCLQTTLQQNNCRFALDNVWILLQMQSRHNHLFKECRRQTSTGTHPSIYWAWFSCLNIGPLVIFWIPKCGQPLSSPSKWKILLFWGVQKCMCIQQAGTWLHQQVGSCWYVQDYSWHWFASFMLLLNNLHTGLGGF